MQAAPKDVRELHLRLFADYHQVVVQDDDIDAWGPDGPEPFDDADLKAGMAATERAVTVFTARNTTVPVRVHVASGPPQDEEGFPRWDHVVQASLDLPSGRVVVAGLSEYFPESQRLDVVPGHYVIRAYSAGLGTLTENGLEGEDHYLIALWPGVSAGVTVLKQGLL